MRELTGLLFGALLCIAAVMTFSVFATRAWQAEPDVTPVRTVGVEEYRRGNAAPVIDRGNPGGCVLTDWRHSPCVFGPNGLYNGQVRNGRFVWGAGHKPRMGNLFQKDPVRRGN